MASSGRQRFQDRVLGFKMNSWLANTELVFPSYVRLAPGARHQIPELAAHYGKRVFLICGSRSIEKQGIASELADQLVKRQTEVVRLAVPSREPEVSDVQSLIAQLKSLRAGTSDVLVALGGGSTIDLTKAAAALVHNLGSHHVTDFLEGVGKGLNIEAAPLTVIAAPTTSGTGAEATKNAVISCYDPLFKKSLRDPRMVPRVAIIDPELTATLPFETTVHTSLDALTQLIESYLSRKSTPLTRTLALEGLTVLWPAVSQLESSELTIASRTALAYGAFVSGVCLTNSGLGLAHGVAAGLGVHAKVPHGLACAVMLPVALRFNSNLPTIDLSPLAAACGFSGNSSYSATSQFIGAIEELVGRLKIPSRLSQLGITRAQIPGLAHSSQGSSMSGNPREITVSELEQLLDEMQ